MHFWHLAKYIMKQKNFKGKRTKANMYINSMGPNMDPIFKKPGNGDMLAQGL